MVMWTRNVLSYDPMVMANTVTTARSLVESQGDANPAYLSARYKWFLQTIAIAEMILPLVQRRVFILHFVFGRNGTEIGIILGRLRTDGRINDKGTTDVNRRNCLRHLDHAVEKVKLFHEKYGIPGPYIIEAQQEEEERDDLEDLMEFDIKRDSVMSVLAHKRRLRHTWDRGYGFGTPYDYDN